MHARGVVSIVKRTHLRRKRPTPRRGPWRSRAYLDTVRAKPCCVCGADGPSDPHHIGPLGSHGMGQQCADYYTVPLCRRCHDAWHDHRPFHVPERTFARCTFAAHTIEHSAALPIFHTAQRDLMAEWIERGGDLAGDEECSNVF